MKIYRKTKLVSGYSTCVNKNKAQAFFSHNKECEQCISLFTLKLIVRFWQDIRNGYM